MIEFLRGLGPQRIITHLILATLTILACIIALLYRVSATLQATVLGTAYAGLAYLAITLLIGPWNLLVGARRRNPVNIHLRRDTGIWAGIAGLVHVVFGFQMHMGAQIYRYFFVDNPHHPFRPLLNLFGVSNYLGLLGTIILAALLLLSNDLSLKWLRGPRWKLIQRFNYGLFVLVIAHAVGYQIVVEREPLFMGAVIAVTLLALIAQATGVAITLTRRRSDSLP